jgi:O-antigen ligase
MLTQNIRRAPDFGNRPENGAVWVSRSLAFLIPLILGIYWPLYAVNVDLAIVILRPAMIGTAFLLALLWTQAPLSWAEIRLAAVMSFMCAILLAPSLSATIVSRALTDWSKLIVMCLMGLLMCRALRDQGTARTFGHSLIVSSILGGGFILVTYVRLIGFVMPTYQSARVFKYYAQLANVPLNALAFGAVFSYICGMCLIRENRWLWLLGFILLLVSVVFGGSRAPVASMAACAFMLLVLNGVFSARLSSRVAAWIGIAAALAAIAIVSQHVTFKQMSDVTEGRWDIWSVAWQKFLERPLLGYGFESWRDDLVSRLPGEYDLTSAIAGTFAGAYHNEYLTMLAEQGVIGFLAVITFFSFLLRCSWKLAFRASYTWRHGQWALLGCLFLMLRAGVEIPGLFGYGQEPVDYLAFLFVAIVLSRFSVEEDYLRSPRADSPPLRAQPDDSGAAAYSEPTYADS